MRFRKALTIASAAFALGVVCGLIAPYEGIFDLIGVPGRGIKWETVQAFLLIYIHNVVATLVVFGLSIVYVGFVVVALNGYMAGTVYELATSRGFTPLQVLAALLPHGVVEIPAILIASAAGAEVLHSLRSTRGLRGPLRKLTLSLILLAVAALIESYITPRVSAAAGLPVAPLRG